MLNTSQNRSDVIKDFPLLMEDSNFEIVDSSPNYNCIAWAANVTDMWWDKLPINLRPAIRFDGVKVDWPFNAPDEFSTKALLHIFTSLKFEVCSNGDYEAGFKKVVIYEKNGAATHMARQLTNGINKGIWSSKLGSSYRVLHSTPENLISIHYGEPKIYLKKSMN
ncbi:MAG: hypothetical protein R2781_06975 [Flavobacteriaceae bacterium]